jgi:CopG family nickel-responsive transcriptional regulator
MQRVTITLDDDLIAEIDQFMTARGYQNRSEAIRDLARAGLSETTSDQPGSSQCVAAIVYTFRHSVRDLPKRLTQTFHEHHDMSVSSLHVHLDPDNCLEVNILRGETNKVRHVAEHVIAERGVKHGQLVILPIGSCS